MDIQFNSKPKSRYKIYILFGLAIAIFAAYGLTHTSLPKASIEDVALVQAQEGEFTLYSQAFGTFESAEELLLTSQASGRVSHIHMRPGAIVEQDTVILVLTNPELEQRYHSAKADLDSGRAEFESFQLEQENQRLDYQGRMADMQADLEQAQLDLDINQELSDRGVSAKLDIARAELTLKQAKQRLQFEQQKYQHFLKVQAFQLKQQRTELDQVEQTSVLLQKQFDEMHVKAGINGRLQNLNVELGETVAIGVPLGRVGSDKKLKATLRIPQFHADQIDIGSEVQLTTKKGQTIGSISRIESVVNNGVVLAEVSIDGQLPPDARPSLPVTGHVFVQSFDSAIYIAQSQGISPRSQIERFVFDESTGLAYKRSIELGDISKNKIQVTTGLQVGERLIPIMRDDWKNHQEIMIN